MTELDSWRAFYEGLGLRTVPLRPRGKRPLKQDWQDDGPLAWTGVPPEANLGIITGKLSGDLVVLDFDTPDLCREVLGMRPRELAVHTIVACSSRGHHVYARHPGVETRVPREGFSILGEGSLVVAPPSVHPSGARYRFLEPPTRIAALSAFVDPELLVAKTEEKAPAKETAAPHVEVQEDVEGVSVEDALAIIERQHMRVVEAWKLITSTPPADRVFEGSGTDPWSRADWLVALCLIQHGEDPARVARLLVSLPGSKAAARGMRYATRTCARAAESARTGRLPGRGA